MIFWYWYNINVLNSLPDIYKTVFDDKVYSRGKIEYAWCGDTYLRDKCLFFLYFERRYWTMSGAIYTIKEEYIYEWNIYFLKSKSKIRSEYERWNCMAYTGTNVFIVR